MTTFQELLSQEQFSKEDLVRMLSAQGKEKEMLFARSAEVKAAYVGNKVYLRGLVEFSNICKKNCYYCGIRAGNEHVSRYTVSEEDVLAAARFVKQQGYGSMVLQSGEQSSKYFSETIARLLEKIHKETGNTIGITLSLGEQSLETYQRWFNAGAKRYLLRIESSNPELYHKIHPQDITHSYKKRMEALHFIRKAGFQLGTGVMIGLPFQTLENLAEDLLFFQTLDVDMVGMGPYIEHSETPLYQYKEELLPVEQRLDLSLKMVAILRLLMKDINIAATTALQTLHPEAREEALRVGANIIMPNMTPQQFRENYFLYQNKAVTKDDAATYHKYLETAVRRVGCEIVYNEHGDSPHFKKKESVK